MARIQPAGFNGDGSEAFCCSACGTPTDDTGRDNKGTDHKTACQNPVNTATDHYSERS